MTATPKVLLRSLDELREDPNNARTHSEQQVEMLAGLIRRFGFTNPILADLTADGLIVAGHGRKAAASALLAAGEAIRLPNRAELPAGKVPVLDCSGWSEEDRRAYALADNASALAAGWDEEVLRAELQALAAADWDLGSLGFLDTRELDRLMRGPKETADPEEVPDVPETPVSRLGDVWLLGDHRLICGSSTVAEDVAAVLAGAKPHLMVTDPPYGVEYDPSWRANTKRSDGSALSTGNVAMGKVENDDRADWSEAWALFPGDVAYVYHGGLHSAEVQRSLEATGFEVRAQIIWDKGRAPISRANYHWQHEPCWYVVRKGKTAHFNGDRKQTTVWLIANNDGANHDREEATSHGTQKPIECMRRPIENNSKRAEGVYEPFSGSGTTIIAAELTGRRCFAVELSPAYVDVAVLRWQKLTGQYAVLEATGVTYAEATIQRIVLEPA